MKRAKILNPIISRIVIKLMAKKSCLGLFVDNESLCVVEVSMSKAGFKLENVATSQLEFVVSDGKVADPKAAAVELQKFFSTAGLSNRNIYVGIPDQSAVTRLLSVPAMSRREMKEVMRGDAEQYVLFSGREIALDFFVADEVKEGASKTNSVLLSAAPKDVVDSWAETFDAAGLEIGGVVPTAIAFLNGVVDHERKSGFHCYLIVGFNNTSLYLIKDGKLTFMRQVDFTMEALSAILPSFEKYKKDIPDEVFAPLNNFTDEISTTLDFFSQQNPREPKVEKVILCVNPEKYRAVELYLEKRLDMSVDLENPMEWMDVTQSAISPSFLESFEHQIPYAAGLAKTALEEKEVFAINLLSEERKVTPLFKKMMGLQFAAVPAVLLLVFLFYGFMLSSGMKHQQEKLSELEQKIKKYVDQTTTLENLKKQKESLTAEMKSLDEQGSGPLAALAGGGFSFGSVFQELRRITPKEVWITNVESSDGDEIQIEGYSKSQVGVSMFLEGIMSTPVLMPPALLQYSESALIGNKNVVKFKVVCHLYKGKTMPGKSQPSQ